MKPARMVENQPSLAVNNTESFNREITTNEGVLSVPKDDKGYTAELVDNIGANQEASVLSENMRVPRGSSTKREEDGTESVVRAKVAGSADHAGNVAEFGKKGLTESKVNKCCDT